MSEWTAETAQWYADKYGEYATNRLAVDALDVDPNAVIVDVGCGTGSALRRVADRAPQGELVGVDPVLRMLEIAQERAADHPEGHRIEFREGPAERLPIDDDHADLVFAFDSIDHWHDKAAGLSEVRRVLRAGGRLVVVKDGGVPDGSRAKREFLDQIVRAGLEVLDEQTLAEDEVACTMWVCGIAQPRCSERVQERNRVNAEAMLHAMGALDVARIRDLCAPSARYWQMGYELPLSGSHDLMDAVQRMPEVYHRLDGGLSYRIFGSTAEGKRVCLEAESHGVLSDGQPYTNQHHTAVHFDDDGRVTALHDYLDTLRIYETLLDGHVNGPRRRPPSVSRPRLRSLPGLVGLALRSARRISSSDRRTRAPAATTTLERNRQQALAFIDAIGEQDMLKLASLYALRGTFWQIGDRLNLAGPHTQMAIADAVPRIYRRLPQGMRFEIHSVVAEGDRVAIESTSHAPLLDGGEYENQYNFLFRFDRDGRVQQFKEYWGTLHAYRTLFRETTVI